MCATKERLERRRLLPRLDDPRDLRVPVLVVGEVEGNCVADLQVHSVDPRALARVQKRVLPAVHLPGLHKRIGAEFKFRTFLNFRTLTVP